VAIPVIVTALVSGTGIVLVNFSRGLLSGSVLAPGEAARVGKMIQMMAFSYFLSVAFAFLVAMVITYAITRPIDRLVRKAREIASGDFSYNLDTVAYDEFSILDRTFNEMAKALKDYRDRLQEYNRNLENTVQERTKELRAVLELSKRMISILEREELLNVILNELFGMVNYQLAGVLLLGEERIEVKLRCMKLEAGPATTQLRDRMVTEVGILSGLKIGSQDIDYSLDGYDAGSLREAPAYRRLESYSQIPLISGNKLLGLLSVASIEPAAFNENHTRILTIVANHAAMAIENVQVYSRLREIDRLKSEFVSTVSHELRTPLTSIVEGIDLLYETAQPEILERLRELLDIIARNARRLNILINDLLDLSKLEAGETVFEKGPLDINSTISELLEGMKVKASSSQVKLESSLCPQAALAYADQNKIIQVLNNLLGNAFKFTPPAGRISVETGWKEDQLYVAISNSGEPIPQHKLKKIFDKFYQIGSSDQPRSRGTGLGLAIAREIIERHGGKIWAESLSDGNRFVFTLPKFEHRLFFEDSLKRMIQEAKANRSSFCLIVLNILNFDQLQDQQGLPQAGEILDNLQQRLEKFIQREGIPGVVARPGVSAMITLLAALDRQAGGSIEERARALIEDSFTQQYPQFRIILRSKTYVYPSDAPTKELLLRQAVGM
jgi:signal transduction histidine kinase